MRKDTTTATDAATLDTIKQPQDARQIDAQEQTHVTPATSGHLDSIEGQDTCKKRKNNTSTQARNKYNNRSYDRIEIRIPKGQREQLQRAAAAAGQSTSAYIINAINAAAGHEIITPLATNPYI